MQAVKSKAASNAASDGLRNIETRIWIRTLKLHGAIYARLNRALAARFGLSLAKFDVLAQLDRFDEGLSQGSLSQYLKVTGGNVTGLVRRLAADGLLRREMSSTDRRSVVVHLTPKGRTAFHAARDMHDALLQELLGGLAGVELQAALNSLNTLCTHVLAEAK